MNGRRKLRRGEPAVSAWMDWLIDWLTDWLTDWLIDWFIYLFIYFMISWFIDFIDLLIYWFIDFFFIYWLIYWFIDLLIYWLMCSLYADDSAVWRSRRNLTFIFNELQKQINAISNGCNKWGFKLNWDKTVMMIFTRKSAAKYSNLSIKIYGKT